MSNLRKNIGFLFIVNISNYLFPILSIPYLARILGPDGVGEIAIAQAVSIYLSFVVDFGFNITGTRDISNLSSKDDRSDLFTTIFYSKLILFIICCVIVVSVLYFYPISEQLKILVLIGLIQVLGSVLFPVWFFQGIQKLSTVAFATTISKFVCTSLIFVFVHEKNDIYMAMLLQSIGYFISGLCCVYIIRRSRLVSLTKFSFKKSIMQLKKGSSIFISYIFSSCYTTLNTTLLGIFSTSREVGFFSSADKVRAVSQSFLSPIQQAVYPHIASERHNLKVLRSNIIKYGGGFICLCLFISIGIFFCSELIVNILFGSQFQSTIPILKIMAFMPFIISIAIVFGQWGLINLGAEKILSKVYILASLFHLSYVFILMDVYKGVGLAISILITETIVSALMFYLFISKVKQWKD
ncbi:flippase [Klebsiella quasipneumoniae]|uniref:flippase n=1 Tax=Klebsiella/Raoultella group TaxID=2890311 RepID=UPI00032ED038|nr:MULTISPECIES: flippase [Klebsiella/Raoultella group]EOQ52182.1 hypothetical protein A1WC_03356 [Klebsiella sp. KTE92]HEM3760171.1 flippase [Klebsiella quasipneumoniae]